MKQFPVTSLVNIIKVKHGEKQHLLFHPYPSLHWKSLFYHNFCASTLKTRECRYTCNLCLHGLLQHRLVHQQKRSAPCWLTAELLCENHTSDVEPAINKLTLYQNWLQLWQEVLRSTWQAEVRLWEAGTLCSGSARAESHFVTSFGVCDHTTSSVKVHRGMPAVAHSPD